MPRLSPRRALVVVLVVVTAAVSAGIAIAASGGGGNGDDAALTGQPLEKASAAALVHTGGGTVDRAEVDDDAGYEVEVRLPNGKLVEVELDSGFAVVAEDAGDGGPGDAGRGDDESHDDEGQSGSADADD